MSEDVVNVVLNYLSAYSWPVIKEAFIRLNKDRVGYTNENRRKAREAMQQLGWILYEGAVEAIPKDFEWTKVGDLIYTRSPQDIHKDTTRTVFRGDSAYKKRKSRLKTDTSVRAVDKIKCPSCGGDLYKEGVCPACEDGKKGFRIRLLCGECDYTQLL